MKKAVRIRKISENSTILDPTYPDCPYWMEFDSAGIHYKIYTNITSLSQDLNGGWKYVPVGGGLWADGEYLIKIIMYANGVYVQTESALSFSISGLNLTNFRSNFTLYIKETNGEVFYSVIRFKPVRLRKLTIPGLDTTHPGFPYWMEFDSGGYHRKFYTNVASLPYDTGGLWKFVPGDSLWYNGGSQYGSFIEYSNGVQVDTGGSYGISLNTGVISNFRSNFTLYVYSTNGEVYYSALEFKPAPLKHV